jgi:hypothetical protein
MPENDNNDIEFKKILLDLVKYNYSSFDSRRKIEWRITIAIWTALAGFIVICLTKKTTLNVFATTWIIWVALSLVLVFIHWRFLKWIQAANRMDKKKAEYFEDTIIQDTEAKWNMDDHNKRAKRLTEVLSQLKPVKVEVGQGWKKWFDRIHWLFNYIFVRVKEDTAANERQENFNGMTGNEIWTTRIQVYTTLILCFPVWLFLYAGINGDCSNITEFF